MHARDAYSRISAAVAIAAVVFAMAKVTALVPSSAAKSGAHAKTMNSKHNSIGR
jgi:hypothetical protein